MVQRFEYFLHLLQHGRALVLCLSYVLTLVFSGHAFSMGSKSGGEGSSSIGCIHPLRVLVGNNS